MAKFVIKRVIMAAITVLISVYYLFPDERRTGNPWLSEKRRLRASLML